MIRYWTFLSSVMDAKVWRMSRRRACRTPGWLAERAGIPADEIQELEQ